MKEPEMVALGTLVGVLIGAIIAWVQRANYKVAKRELSLVSAQLAKYQKERKDLQERHLEQIGQITRLEEEKKYLSLALVTKKEQEKEVEEKLLLQFKELSNELLERKSDKFSKQNREQIEGLLLPFRERLTDFQRQLAMSRQSAQEDTLVLKQEFSKVNTLYEKIREDSARATRAIMGDNKLQGTWGEAHAMQLLENTGLRKDEHYFVQKGFSGTDGKRYIPDIIIKLPGKRSIVMDVKISLIDYVKFFNATDPKEKAPYLKKHLASIKSHIKSLSEKNYAQSYQLDGLDFVLLLLPVEPAFSLAIQHEPSLFQEAYERNIVLVSPTTLRATLSIIEQIWKNVYRNEHALEIARQGGLLYDKFAGFVQDLKKVGIQFASGQKALDQAMNKLSEGKGNLISKVEQLKRLGARTSKVLT